MVEQVAVGTQGGCCLTTSYVQWRVWMPSGEREGGGVCEPGNRTYRRGGREKTNCSSDPSSVFKGLLDEMRTVVMARALMGCSPGGMMPTQVPRIVSDKIRNMVHMPTPTGARGGEHQMRDNQIVIYLRVGPQ